MDKNKATEKSKKNKRNGKLVNNNKVALIGMVSVMVISGLAFKVGYIKYAYGSDYEKTAIMQLINENNLDQTIYPGRGEILDRNKLNLATSTAEYKVILDIRNIVNLAEPKPDDKDKDEKYSKDKIVRKLSEHLSIPVEELNEYFAVDPVVDPLNPDKKKPIEDYDTHWFQIPNVQVSRKIAMEIKEDKLRDVHLEEVTKRTYVHDNLAAQVLGFFRGEYSGLERTYNKELSGEPGRLFRTYDTNNVASTRQIQAVQGYNLITTLDLKIQEFAEKAVLNAGKEFEPVNASAIVMNPQTGEILAMAQYPSANINEPDNLEYINREIDTTKWAGLEPAKQTEELYNELYKVWNNYNVTQTFEPGSIFKPVTVAAALEEGVISTSEQFYCGGYKEVAGFKIYCADHKAHGSQTLEQTLSNSCNVAMMNIAERLGRKRFHDYQAAFGYGQKTGIDLPGEEPAASAIFSVNALNSSELATSSFGQGFTNTAIQAITSFSALVNGGNLMKPYIVSQVVDRKGNTIKENKPTVLKKAISKETSDYLRKALQSVISPTGTGWRAYIKGYAIGGKTGTAQVGKREKDEKDQEYAYTYIGYLTVDNPEIMVITIINRPDKTKWVDKQSSVGPMFRALMEDIIKYKGIKPEGEVSPEDSIASESNSFTLEDFSGQQLIDVTNRLSDTKLDYECVGNGVIVDWHQPAGGTQVTNGDKIYLYLSNPDNEALEAIPKVKGIPVSQAVEILAAAGFEPIIYDDTQKVEGDNDQPSEPVTYNPAHYQEQAEQEELTAKVYLDEEKNDKLVAEQMPSAEAKIQRGSIVILKVK